MDGIDLRCRLATAADIEGLLRLLPQLSRQPTGEQGAMPTLEESRRIFERMQRHGNVFFVAEGGEAGSLLGSCMIVIVPNLTYSGRPWAVIENVVVDGARRGRGVGARMVEYACGLAREQGCYKVQLLSGPRPEQVRFYQRLGFDDQRSVGFKRYL